MSTSYRSLVRFLGPKWLTRDQVRLPNGSLVESDSRVLYSIMTMFDLMTSRLRQGIAARMPRPKTPEDALTYIGLGLDVLRGPSEPIDVYKTRLQRAVDDKRFAGNAWGLLNQIRGYCYPHAVRVRIVNSHGNWYTLDRNATQSYAYNTAWNWDNAVTTARLLKQRIPWSTFWVIIYPTTGSPQKPWAKAGNWGSGDVWGAPSSRTWGSTATSDDVFAIRRIVKRWKPDGSRCVRIIVAFNDTDFDPTNASTFPTDGTWGGYAKFNAATPGRMAAARNANAIYWSGTSNP